MKKIYLLGFFIGLIAFAGCSEEDPIQPTPSPAAPAGTQGVYFPANESAFELEPTAPRKFELTIARKDSVGAVDVPITVEVNDKDIFNVPATVSFVDGQAKTTFEVTFPNAAEGVTYNLRLLVEGDGFVNPYAADLPYVATNVTRIKWSPVTRPLIYVDGAFTAFFGVNPLPMYVYADSVVLGDVVRYRFKNPYKVPTGVEFINDDGDPDFDPTPDEDGIYDGYPYNEPGDFDESQNYYTIIEIDDEAGKSGDVFMFAGNIGVDWGYGMHSIGSAYDNLSEDNAKYPLGKMKDGIITFPGSSLYMNMANYGTGVADDPTTIYMSKEIYIAANLKIDDFNDVEYEDEADAVETGAFISTATSDTTLLQVMVKAIDVDEDNDESEYKNLYYLPNLYEDDYGLAFYYTEEAGISIPANQHTGMKFLGKDVLVSMSRDSKFKSAYIIGAEEPPLGNDVDEEDHPDHGIDRYVFGLNFHFKDGTSLGDFSERLLLIEEDVNPAMGNRKSPTYHFKVQGKASPKKLDKNVQKTIIL
ncbi:MAG TPA: hypothetical protein VKX35_05305 [Fermentimonas sp.]|nr:hypothetical protein [Fermentimonas sp.]